jgi:hypothetical protein
MTQNLRTVRQSLSLSTRSTKSNATEVEKVLAEEETLIWPDLQILKLNGVGTNFMYVSIVIARSKENYHDIFRGITQRNMR